MRHTYLLEPNTWRAVGQVFGAHGSMTEADGEAAVQHEPELWVIQSSIRLVRDGSPLFENRYEIAPWDAGSDTTSWRLRHGLLGEIKGRFVIVGDSILSASRSTDGRHSGTEYLQQLTADRYLNRGALFRGRTMISSWSFELVRRT